MIHHRRQLTVAARIQLDREQASRAAEVALPQGVTRIAVERRIHDTLHFRAHL